MQTAEIEGQQS